MTDEIRYYVELFRNNPDELKRLADERCRAVHGGNVYVRGLIEFTNHCSMNCNYCGIRRDNAGAHRYRMSADEIISCAVSAYASGVRTFVLQGGEDGSFTDAELTGIIGGIKDATGPDTAITLSVGIRSRASFERLKAAGADRYLLRFETSNESLYRSLKSGEPLERRIDALRVIRELGFETGSGFMTGLPGETEDDVINNCLLAHGLALDMVGVGPFIPHPDTPLAGSVTPDIDRAVRAVALVRLLLPNAHIPATTAAGSLHPRGRELMLAAGANVVMPNVTPVKFKKDYLLYPGKICLDEEYQECAGCLAGRVRTVGKELNYATAGAIR